MEIWSRPELEATFSKYVKTDLHACESGDWGPRVEMYAQDATYVDHLYGAVHGRSAIRDFIQTNMARFPGSQLRRRPTSEPEYDESSGTISFEAINEMPDLGDGVVRAAPNTTRLTCTPDYELAREEVTYNAAEFVQLIRAWMRRASELGKLPREARTFMDRFS